MALKALMLKRELDDKQKALAALTEKDAELEKREKELEQAIDEAQTEDEKRTVTEAIENFETEKAEQESIKSGLEEEIRKLEDELKETETADEAAEAPEASKPAEEAREKEDANMQTRDAATISGAITKRLKDLGVQERDALFMREDVKAWIGEIRAHISEKRELTNVGLTIPEVFLGYLRENVLNYSKLYKHVNVQRISGTGREVVMGTVPEGVWTECCATLNELSLGFSDVSVDCYKVGGYFKVCNALLEDSDLNLASLLLDSIGQAIGLALDKAILYGRNNSTNYKMPQGVISRLVQTSKPADYPATAREWTDLHTSNVITIPNTATGVDLYKAIVSATAAVKGKYARGTKVWVMNEATYTKLQVEAMSINAAGAIVSGMSGTMPVAGGIVEVLDFIPNNVIIVGYFELYLLAERAGQKFAQSEHAFFIQDQTAFKGTARYDGVPVIAEAFAAIGIDGTTPSSTMTFASDEANANP